MKKHNLMIKIFSVLLFSICFFFVSHTVRGQIGFKAGINQTSSFFPYLFSESRTGLHLGVFREYALSKKFQLRGEIVYSQKGFSEEGFDQQLGIAKVRIHHNYIDANLIFEYELFNQVYFQVGSVVAVLVNRNYDLNGIPFQVDDMQNRLDISPLAGFRKKINDHWGSSFRFSHSIWSIDGWWAPDNVVLSFGLEYFLGAK